MGGGLGEGGHFIGPERRQADLFFRVFRVVFSRMFLKGVREVCFRLFYVFWGPWGGQFWRYF